MLWTMPSGRSPASFGKEDGLEEPVNFDEAIAAHLQWRTRLSCYVAQPDRSLSAADVILTDRCELGRWIGGEGKRYGGIPDFTSLVASHAQFHRAAAAVVAKADSGQCVTQDIALGLQSGYGAASAEIVKTLMVMKTRVPAAI
jgi:methyl-accepting chemotaxis protein